MTEPLITGTDFILVSSDDFERSRTFYGETLGLEESKRWGSMPGIEFETGNLTLAVLEIERFGGTFAPSTSAVALRVDDVAARRAELEGRGVEFSGDIVDSGVCHQAYFKDPDGNPLILHHRYAPRE